MNREIKFRGKSIMDNTYGNWLYSSGIKYGDDVELMYCDEDTSEEWHYIDKNTLGQYTGLNDKNGKEIYEGDIVEYENMTGKIMFFNGSFILSDLEETEEWELGVINEEIEVIGNIYENSELLGGE